MMIDCDVVDLHLERKLTLGEDRIIMSYIHLEVELDEWRAIMSDHPKISLEDSLNDEVMIEMIADCYSVEEPGFSVLSIREGKEGGRLLWKSWPEDCE